MLEKTPDFRHRTMGRYFVALMLLQAMATVIAASADEPAVIGQLSMVCAASQATSSHTSTSSTYTVTGACNLFVTSRGITSPSGGSVVDWRATGSHQPNTKATVETVTLTLTDGGKPIATGSIHSSMQCGSDPWRILPTGPCRLVARTTQPPSLAGYLSMAQQQLLQDAPQLPLSVKLSPSQRAALEKQYQLSFATRQKPGVAGPFRDTPMGSPLSPANQAGVGAATTAVPDWPVIVDPKPEAHVVQGQFIIKATPPHIGNGFSAELEFTWLDASALNRYVNIWPVSMDQLVKGMAVPAGVTRGQAGRWQVRARVSNPTTGSWSAPVSFTLHLTQPTQSLQKPLAPQQSPSQGFGGTQLIRPRGIEQGDQPSQASPSTGPPSQAETAR